MDNDFKPAEEPAKSLHFRLDALTQTPKPETNFRTPEEVAAADDIVDPAMLPEDPQALAAPPPAETKPASSWRSNWRQKLRLHWPPGKKEWLVAAVAILVLGGIVGLVLAQGHKAPPPKPTAKIVKLPPKPTTVASTLTGLPVDPSVNARPVTGVMIENTTDARPQSGLGQAGVVFEAIAEGGVTRFLALFQDTAPANVGPIRSARPYYIQWDLGFDAAYAHVGGSPDALADIKAWGVKDLDEFANGGSYHRVSSRLAPHNVYTAITTLNQLETAKGYLHSNYSGFLRKPAAPLKVPTAKSINLTLSGPIYNVHYDYNPATNTYNRSEGGAAHIDANTNTQISPNVVVALVMPYSLGALDATGAYYSVYSTIGSGQAFIFQDGSVTAGQWTKSAATSQFSFTDASGKPLGLDPGQTWLTAVGSATDVASTP